MIGLTITLNGDGAWPDLQTKEVTHATTEAIQVAVLEHGMVSGRPSVAFRIDLPDGKVVVAQTTARLFCMAARAITSKYPDLFRDS